MVVGGLGYEKKDERLRSTKLPVTKGFTGWGLQPGSTVINTSAMSSLTDDSWMYGDDNLATYRNNEPLFCASGINSGRSIWKKKRMHQKSMMKYSVKALTKDSIQNANKNRSLHLVLLANEMEKNNTYTNGIYLIILDLCCLFNLVCYRKITFVFQELKTHVETS